MDPNTDYDTIVGKSAGTYVWALYDGAWYPASTADEVDAGAATVMVGFSDGSGAEMPLEAVQVMNPNISDDDPKLQNENTREEAMIYVSNLRAQFAEADRAEEKQKRKAEKEQRRAEKEKKAAEKEAKKEAKKQKKKQTADADGDDDDELLLPGGVRVGDHHAADAGSDDDLFEHEPAPAGMVRRKGPQQQQSRASRRFTTTADDEAAAAGAARTGADNLTGHAANVMNWAQDEFSGAVGMLRELNEIEAAIAAQPPPPQAAEDDAPGSPGGAAARRPPKPKVMVLRDPEEHVQRELKRDLLARSALEQRMQEAMKEAESERPNLPPEQARGLDAAMEIFAKLSKYDKRDFEVVRTGTENVVISGGERPPKPTAKPARHRGRDPLTGDPDDAVDYGALEATGDHALEIAMARTGALGGSSGRLGSAGGVPRPKIMSKWGAMRRKVREGGLLGTSTPSATTPRNVDAARRAAANLGVTYHQLDRFALTTRGPTKPQLTHFGTSNADLKPAPVYSGLVKSVSFTDAVPSASAQMGFDQAAASAFQSATKMSVLPVSADLFAQSPSVGDEGSTRSKSERGESHASSAASRETTGDTWRSRAKATVRKVLTYYFRGEHGRPVLIKDEATFAHLGSKLLARVVERVYQSHGLSGNFGPGMSADAYTPEMEGKITASIDQYMQMIHRREEIAAQKAAKQEQRLRDIERRRREREPATLEIGAGGDADDGGASSSAQSTDYTDTSVIPSAPGGAGDAYTATGSSRSYSPTSHTRSKRSRSDFTSTGYTSTGATSTSGYSSSSAYSSSGSSYTGTTMSGTTDTSATGTSRTGTTRSGTTDTSRATSSAHRSGRSSGYTTSRSGRSYTTSGSSRSSSSGSDSSSSSRSSSSGSSSSRSSSSERGSSTYTRSAASSSYAASRSSRASQKSLEKI